MQQWEYRTIQGLKESMGFQWTSNIGETLNRMGEQGWELVAVVEAQRNLVDWVFKRPKSQVLDMPSPGTTIGGTPRGYPASYPAEQRIA